MSDTMDAEIDEILQSYWYECRELHSTKGKAVDHASVKAKAKLKALLLRERELGRIDGLSAAWGFTTMYSGQELKDMITQDMLKAKSELSRLSGEGEK